MKLQSRGVAICVALAALTPLSASLPMRTPTASQSQGVAQHHEGAVAAKGATAFLATHHSHHRRHALPRLTHMQLRQKAKSVRSKEEPEAASEDDADEKDEGNSDSKDAGKEEDSSNNEDDKDKDKADEKTDGAKDEEAAPAKDIGDERANAKDEEKGDEKDAEEANEKDDEKGNEETTDGKDTEKAEDDSEQQEVVSTKVDSNPPVPPTVPSMYAPSPASADDAEDEDDKGPGAQDPVVAIVTISNLDYDKLADDQPLHGKVEEVIREAIAASADEDIDSDDVSLVSWSGSVRARTVIKPMEGVNSDTVMAALTKSSSDIAAAITDGVSQLKGIKPATKGIITTDVDVLVATMTSSVSKVMSRAKAQGHLGRVYDLEKQASDARKRIHEIAAKEVWLDRQIANISDEEAFTEMVDDRVKKVKSELQAPVFADTIGDMWKELRMFGTPCFLKVLRKERAELAEQLKEAETNATTVEEQLQSARDDVTDAWYPPKKSNSAMVWYGPVSSFAVIFALFF